MDLAVEVNTPGTLVINQNFHRDWHADRGTLLNHDGLLALRVSETGPYDVRLRYHPRGFYAGVVLTALAMLAGVVFGRNWYTGSRRPPSA
jgi:uncharacterized membrane protein